MRNRGRSLRLLASTAVLLTAPTSPPAAFARPASRDKAAPYSARIDRELESLASLEMDSDLETTDSILSGVARFGALAAIVEKADKHGLSAQQEAKVARFRSELARIQRLQLPRLRDAYGSALGRELREREISIRVFGDRSTVIECAGSLFAGKRNIKRWQTSFSDRIRQLRFKQTRYKGYAKANEGTAYTMTAFDDDELVVWLDDGRYRVVP